MHERGDNSRWSYILYVCLSFTTGFIIGIVGLYLMLGRVVDVQPNERFSDCCVGAGFNHELDCLDTAEYHCRSCSLSLRVFELMNQKTSILNELRTLEQAIQEQRSQIVSDRLKLYEIEQLFASKQRELDQLLHSVEQAKIGLREVQAESVPYIAAPNRLLPSAPARKLSAPAAGAKCNFELCFDYSSCSLFSGFPAFTHAAFDAYTHQICQSLSHEDADISACGSVAKRLSFLWHNSYTTFNISEACVFIVPILISDSTALSDVDTHALTEHLLGLESWRGDGRNHLLWIITTNAKHGALPFFAALKRNIGRALLVQSDAIADYFQLDFDLIVFPFMDLLRRNDVTDKADNFWTALTSISPARRTYLLTFWGEPRRLHIRSSPHAAQSLYFAMTDTLRTMQLSYKKTRDRFYFAFNCSKSGVVRNTPVDPDDSLSHQFDSDVWKLCESEDERAAVLRESTFSLVPLAELTVLQDSHQLIRLAEALKYGAIPVLLGGFSSGIYALPFAGFVDWRLAVLQLPSARLPELHFYLRTISDAEIISLRRNGRRIFETYLRSDEVIFNAVLAEFRSKLLIPPPAISDFQAASVYNDSNDMKKEDMPYSPETEEFLGPSELPHPSSFFQRNFTLLGLHAYTSWNLVQNPFNLFPSVPSFDEFIPSEAKFKDLNVGFRPIADGAGGSGKEFSESLGGNFPREQFTIVLLTYEREAVLVSNILRLNKLPYLNKIIVVWNSDKPPSAELVWPRLNVPIEVIRTGRNSLNNRFLPYSLIETEAILSLDDDAHLRHDEIVFGFRVWREARDRIVGFPGRFHSWDREHGAWLYNSNHSCELSMVLTGAAFYHRYYSYAYSYAMPQAIRDKVDELMNCEDIAFNFLVSHLTRKPPIKVTSRWTFRCSGCPETLSHDDSHFYERHDCINFFTRVYGYNPLLYTQFRVDSVLFKTRLPHNHQKCFKFI